ncbi:zf-TFIIB domain-containing protein [Devosia sp.]|uniref:TFIIB-type zinc ribbon-containing protein n=1 Tax=Devosia sp. TaxID=1871048 RepID=UPI002F0AF6CE
MKCPHDGVELMMSERQGIEIDYCPLCRGVWLDRGELDKIIERAAQEAPRQEQGRSRPAEPPQHAGRRPGERYEERRYDDDDDRNRGPHRRRGSFLGELFDFD